MEEREYQRALTEWGRRENIIVCLPTGSGKTLIAVNIMNSPEMKAKVFENGKKIIFLVHTVELAQQQAEFIRSQSNYKVLVCTSHSCGGWGNTRWKSELAQHHVFVMIAQLCYDKLLANILSFKELALLVVDECHNATKHHKMNEVMDLYHKYVKANNGNCERPRIIGLTATINKTKMKEVTLKNVEAEVRALESRMAARAVSFDDVEQVQKFSTSSRLNRIDYDPRVKPEWGDLVASMQKVQDFIASQKRSFDLPDIARELMRSPNGVNFSVGTIYWGDSPDAASELNRIVLDFMDLYTELGPLASWLTIDHKQSKLDGVLLNKVTDKRSWAALNIAAVKTQLTQISVRVAKMLKTFLNEGTPALAFSRLVSYKFEALLDQLSFYRSKVGTDDALVGLVFVKRRSCAVAVKSLIEAFAMADPDRYGFLKPEVITGASNLRKDVQATRVSVLQQRRIIEAFRKGEVNLIICTTVLEEGIDVPSCNLVVRFDEVHAYTSFIQSMGRARKKGAKFLALTAGLGNFDVFMAQHQVMTTVLNRPPEEREGDELVNALSRMILEDDPARDIEDFEPLGASGPKITGESAIPLVYQYIQRDPKNRSIISWYRNVLPPPEDKTKVFQAHVYIKGSPLFHGPVIGPPEPSTEAAKKAVFLKVAETLWKNGALDEHLVPVG